MSDTTNQAQGRCYACATSSNPDDLCPAHMDLDYRGIQDSTQRRLRAIMELGRVRDQNAIQHLRARLREHA